jgi:putative endonuclease
MADFRELPHTRAQGREGEDEAERWLKRRGYRIVERNFSCKAGEIDIIARDGEVLCFVEIKARANRTYGTAIESISVSKQRRIARAASWYLVRHPTDAPCRFDVLALDLVDGEWRYRLVKDAFSL